VKNQDEESSTPQQSDTQRTPIHFIFETRAISSECSLSLTCSGMPSMEREGNNE
jgi:hypothetical protein